MYDKIFFKKGITFSNTYLKGDFIMKIILEPKKSKNVHSRGNCCNDVLQVKEVMVDNN